MLEQLSIKNYALIEDLKIECKQGLNVFTGETGAGKSIVIDALGLVLGDRATMASIRKGNDSCTIKAVFNIKGKNELSAILEEQSIEEEEGMLILSREVSISGKNKCLANGHSITLGMLQSIGQRLVDLHGQHEHQALLASSEQMNILDECGKLWVLRKRVSEAVEGYLLLQAEWQEMLTKEQSRMHFQELYTFQLQELKDAALRPGEEEELDKEIALLSNAEKIYGCVNEAYQRLYENEESILSNVQKVKDSLTCVQNYDHALDPLTKLIEESAITLEEINNQIRDYKEKIVFDPERLDQCLQRKELLSRLKRKYGSTVKEIMQHQEKIERDLKEIGSLEGNRQALKEKIEKAREKVFAQGQTLTQARKKTAVKLQKEVEAELKEVGLAKMMFTVNFVKRVDAAGKEEIHSTGAEEVVFMIRPNVGEDAKPLSHIASGGEMSRIMLCLKTVLAEADKIPVLVFDEIDTGIGGDTALLVGKKISSLAKTRQILCVTHWPQIAGCAGHHFNVTKSEKSGRTSTRVTWLAHKERVQELARMLGDSSGSEISLKHARQLIRNTLQDA